jgi:uncharacterized protein with PQ loop repeat
MIIFGIVSTAIGVTRAIPQLVRLLCTRHAYGVSVDTAATSMIVSFGWAIYGLLTYQPAISFASAASGIIFALITISALRFGRQLREFRIAPVWLVVLLLLGSIGRTTGLSIALPISVLAANIPQLWVAYKEGNLADLSLGTWLLSMTEGLIWCGYGLVQRDIPVLVNNVFQLTTSAMIAALKLAYVVKQARSYRVGDR